MNFLNTHEEKLFYVMFQKTVSKLFQFILKMKKNDWVIIVIFATVQNALNVLYIKKIRRFGKMDFNTILQAISTVGFPIVCCAALFWKMNKDNERHKEEMETIRTAIENNTAALIELQVKVND